MRKGLELHMGSDGKTVEIELVLVPFSSSISYENSDLGEGFGVRDCP